MSWHLSDLSTAPTQATTPPTEAKVWVSRAWVWSLRSVGGHRWGLVALRLPLKWPKQLRLDPKQGLKPTQHVMMAPIRPLHCSHTGYSAPPTEAKILTWFLFCQKAALQRLTTSLRSSEPLLLTNSRLWLRSGAHIGGYIWTFCEVVPSQDDSASMDMEIMYGLFHASFVAMMQLHKDSPSLSGHQNHSHSPIQGSCWGIVPSQVGRDLLQGGATLYHCFCGLWDHGWLKIHLRW